ncbi:MAG: fibronectin type III domain-containing protein [Saprospiraceae bacterium]|nr:fibronectin type III domain-containing protein [Saprospiraceae bacterium]
MFSLRILILPTLWLAAGCCWVSAQNAAPVSAHVQQFRDQGGVFQPLQFFTPSARRDETASLFAPQAQFLSLDPAQLASAIPHLPTALTLQLVYQDEILTLDLLETNIQTADFSVVTSSSDGRPVSVLPGRHYRGVLRGDGRSLAALSFFQDEIMGLISDDQHGNLVLGKLENPLNRSEYILYSDRELSTRPGFSCEALLPDVPHSTPKPSPQPDVNGCVRVYFECDYELFQNKGSVQATLNYVTGAFNQVATLYANEQISTTLSQVFVWITPDSYSTSSSSTALNQFKALRKSYNGDIAHLVSIGGNNLGGVAYLDVLCVPSYAYAFSDINTSYSNVPTFSWTVEVLTHEMGHNLGSPHTQSCTWPGGAIDNCFTTEGGCSPGPAPSNGGTIMSYCHLTSTGINFNNGFGTLPGNKIRAEVSSATCLAGTCAAAASCQAPTALSANNISGANATISWTAVTGANSYTLQWRTVGATTWTTLNNVSSPYQLTGLPASQNVEVAVRSNCGSGSSNYSYGMIFTSSSGGGTGGGTTCGTPGNLSAAASSSTTAQVSWSAVTGANSYQLSYKNASSGTWLGPVTLTTTNYTLNGLTAATAYNVRVSALCSTGTSPYATTSFSTPGGSGGTCGAPANLSASAGSPTTASVTWSSVSGASYYQLWYKPASSTIWSAAINTASTAYSLSGLSANTAYNVRVRTVCGNLSSLYSTSNFTTPAGGGGGQTCATPGNFTLNSVTSSSAIISWSPVSGATGYDLQIKLASSANWLTFVNLPTNVVQITNMQPGKSYQARVRARCSSTLFSAYTAILAINTPANATNQEEVALLPEGGMALDLQKNGADGDAALQVYPNPSSGWVTVSSLLPTGRLEWLDLNGRSLRVEAVAASDSATRFDLSAYPPGVYLVRMTAEGQAPLVRRVVKQ